MSTTATESASGPGASAVEAPYVLRHDEGGIARLTLNRPERFNPLSAAMIAALQAELDAIASDPSVRVVVLGAAGRGFSAGHDLKEMSAHLADGDWERRLFDDCSRLMVALTRLPQPCIARVHGIATAAGCQLVSMCDLAVAADTATFALPGASVGVFCSTPAVGVSRNVGRKRAMEMLLTAQPIDARTALEWGLVNRVVPAEEIDAEVRRLTDAILARSAAVIGLGKKVFYEQLEQALGEAYGTASEAMAANLRLGDASEGIDAFLKKRSPQWQDPKGSGTVKES